jgi:hypothetical protein
MSRNGIVRFIVVVLSGIAVVVALAALVASMRDGGQPLGAAFARSAGWIVPLVAGGAVGGFTWLMLSSTAGGQRSCGGPMVPCPLCGNEVLGEWRMCPYCGESFEDVAEGETTLPAA